MAFSLKPASLIVILSLLALPTLAEETKSQSEVVPSTALNWGYLNPLRGDKSPRAADLWGDRTKNAATGMLVGFNKGFSSPPHIHNITYRGVVIEGLLHNDDPTAEKLWLPATSFWTQPAGENHITAASGETNLIYLEIDAGPYLVKPSSNQFDNGERPINVHASNLVWLDQTESNLIQGDKVALAHLWESDQFEIQGALIRLSAGFEGSIVSDTQEFRAVVIQGELEYGSSEVTTPLRLLPGSYFGSSGSFSHNVTVSDEVTVYVRSGGTLQVASAD